MLDSLSQFIDISKQLKFQPQKTEISRTTPNTPNNQNYNSTLIYSTQDKSIYLSKINQKKNKYEYQKKKFHQSLLKQNNKSNQYNKQSHWIERNPISQNFINSKHKLLKAVIKTREYQGIDHEKTAYDKSLGRIVSAYSKIKTKPIQFWFPPKMPQNRKNEHTEDVKYLGLKSNSQQEKKILNLQNSIKWAKKHGKNTEVFKKQMFKSLQKMNNIQLSKRITQIKKQEVKIEEEKRRSARLDFKNKLKQKQAKYIMTKQLQQRLQAMKKQNKGLKQQKAINNLFDMLFYGQE